MADQLIFDQGASDALDVMAAPYAVTSMSFPAPPLETATAGSIDTEGDLIAARRHQNRTVSLTVEVRGTSQADVEAQLAPLQQKFALVARQGGTLTRITSAGTTRILDLLAGDAYEPAFDLTYFYGHLATVQIGLLARPYARGPEAALGGSTHAASSVPANVIARTVLTGSDVPGLARIQVVDGTGNAVGSVLWGIQGRFAPASPTSTTALTYFRTALKDLTASGWPTALAGGGAAVLGISVAGPPALASTHVGDFRVVARAKIAAGATAESHVWLRWAPFAAQTRMAENATIILPPSWANHWRLLDLGVVRVPEYPKHADHAWRAEVWAALGTGGAATLDISDVLLVPITEGSAVSGTPNATASELAMIGSGTMEVRSDAVEKQTADGWAPIPNDGDYAMIPATGTVRVLVRPMVGELVTRTSGTEATTRDDAGYDVTVTVYETPRYLTVF